MKILHVVGAMNRAGVETWLMHLLRNIDRSAYCFDFLVHTIHPSDYDDEIRALGSKIIPCPYTHSPIVYMIHLYNILKHGHYDVLHTHVHHFSGLVILVGKLAGVKVRIAHSHSNTSGIESNANFLRRMYLSTMQMIIRHFATHRIGVSHLAGSCLFGGEGWLQNKANYLIYCGLDFSKFKQPVDKGIRDNLGIPEGYKVIGHVGRFEHPKNHLFLLEIMRCLHGYNPHVHLLLIGRGSLEKQIRQKVSDYGLESYVTFAGVRDDVPELMKGAMDIFVLPSLYEGLGLVLLEAQASGLRCVASNVIPHEADVVKALIHRVSLQESAQKWAEIIREELQGDSLISSTNSLKTILASPFTIDANIQSITSLYQSSGSHS